MPTDETFPATQLKPYAEPVGPSAMKVGRVYFSVEFLDHDLLVPVLQPLIFLGFNLNGRNPSLRFFQNFDSFRSGVRYPGTNEDVHDFEVCGPEQGKHIFEYERALEGLMKCALNRRQVKDLDQRIQHSGN